MAIAEEVLRRGLGVQSGREEAPPNHLYCVGINFLAVGGFLFPP